MREFKTKAASPGKFVWTPVLLVVIIHLAAIFGFWFYSGEALLFFLAFHFIAGCLGAVIGMHRYFSHKVFHTSTFFQGLLGYFAVLNLQGGPISWAMYHRAHHIDTDMEGDPHSAKRGFLWSHLAWNFFLAPNGFRRRKHLIRDLTVSKWLNFLEHHHILVNIATLAIFAAIFPRLDLIIWAFPVRIVVVWHSVWLINSYVHAAPLMAGASDTSFIRNSFLVSLLMYGEGWHRNHHELPNSPTTSKTWAQFDPGFWVLFIMHTFGLIRLKNMRLDATEEYL